VYITHPAAKNTHPKGGKLPSQPPTGIGIGGVTAGIAATQKKIQIKKRKQTSFQDHGPNAKLEQPTLTRFLVLYFGLCGLLLLQLWWLRLPSLRW